MLPNFRQQVWQLWFAVRYHVVSGRFAVDTCYVCICLFTKYNVTTAKRLATEQRFELTTHVGLHNA
jgi:hypothetical protein